MRLAAYFIGGILAVSLLLLAALYFGSLDWRYSHTKSIDALPVFTRGDGDGEYRLEVGEMTFRARYAGAHNSGDPIILLHGFPESLIMWDALAKHAAVGNFRVLAFDQRGYSPGARPDSIEDYQLWSLIDDVVDVADHMEFKRFHLVGHDWGAGVGWGVVAAYPERLISWTGLAIPHISTFMDGVINDPEQRSRSRYFEFNQRPWLPEFMFLAANQRLMKSMLAKLPEAHLAEYLRILSEPGAFSAAVNWYRAMDVASLASDPVLSAPVSVPTRFIWGTNDGVIAPSVVAHQAAKMRGPFDSISLEAGHALMQEQPDVMIGHILSHIEKYSETSKLR